MRVTGFIKRTFDFHQQILSMARRSFYLLVSVKNYEKVVLNMSNPNKGLKLKSTNYIQPQFFQKVNNPLVQRTLLTF